VGKKAESKPPVKGRKEPGSRTLSKYSAKVRPMALEAAARGIRDKLRENANAT
jgi:hypothetical protein